MVNTFLSAELRLVKTAEQGEFIQPGQPFIFGCWRDRVDLFSEPTIFLSERVVRRTPSKHTWEALGYDLLRKH